MLPPQVVESAQAGVVAKMMSHPLAFVTRPPLAIVRKAGSVVLNRNGKFVCGPPATWPGLIVIVLW